MLEQIKEKLPELAKDARINLGKALDVNQTDGLSVQQIIGSALAVAYHIGNPTLTEALETEFEVEQSLCDAAKLAASLMAMTNIYYRFIHYSEQPELSHVPAGLRMQGMMNPGTDKSTFEAMSLAVSILNGCSACISAHCRNLKEHGFSAQALARIGRIAAVIHSVNVSLGL
ncbi:alkylhydroperoxidase [Legionella beliardensis]|uniref:Alkyl hydroperoxide reductase AhpD n=1 Tax=Legionella beliardensis TaxID=91822 RepID=A0A378I0I8_9GAMM|nr:carboxymuconolactone decarboxylase family protein [Legionella beliardensis]STX28175.1 alkylhydroperoxidase [Legionella beliardensis]